jgi:hypothetical protein
VQLIADLAPLVTFAESAVNAAPKLLDSEISFTSTTPLVGRSLAVAGETIGFGGLAIGTATGGDGKADSRLGLEAVDSRRASSICL